MLIKKNHLISLATRANTKLEIKSDYWVFYVLLMNFSLLPLKPQLNLILTLLILFCSVLSLYLFKPSIHFPPFHSLEQWLKTIQISRLITSGIRHCSVRLGRDHKSMTVHWQNPSHKDLLPMAISFLPAKHNILVNMSNCERSCHRM